MVASWGLFVTRRLGNRSLWEGSEARFVTDRPDIGSAQAWTWEERAFVLSSGVDVCSRSRRKWGRASDTCCRAPCKMKILPLVPKLSRMSRGQPQSIKSSWAALLSAGRRLEKPPSSGI